VTDRGHRCERSAWTGVLPPESVTTLLYAVEAPAGER
jgi:hypothetical protein